jgi:hypothetical protein
MVCNICGTNKHENEFYVLYPKDQKIPYRMKFCKQCTYKKQLIYRENNPEVKRMSAYRAADRKSGMENNLTREFIKNRLFNNSKCSYCNVSGTTLTLDRINSNKGHTMDNVVVACVHCNRLRRNIPYDIWRKISSKMNIAMRLGLLNEWYEKYEY